jgi:hypothetical protein
LAKAIEYVGGFAGAGGSREQPHRLQCSAGRRKVEKRPRRLGWTRPPEGASLYWT